MEEEEQSSESDEEEDYERVNESDCSVMNSNEYVFESPMIPNKAQSYTAPKMV